MKYFIKDDTNTLKLLAYVPTYKTILQNKNSNSDYKIIILHTYVESNPSQGKTLTAPWTIFKLLTGAYKNSNMYKLKL